MNGNYSITDLTTEQMALMGCALWDLYEGQDAIGQIFNQIGNSIGIDAVHGEDYFTTVATFCKAVIGYASVAALRERIGDVLEACGNDPEGLDGAETILRNHKRALALRTHVEATSTTP